VPLNFLKPEGGGFEKIQRDERRRALKIFTSLKNVSQNNLTTNHHIIIIILYPG
jgi:flagellar biogenesis protein FliO